MAVFLLTDTFVPTRPSRMSAAMESYGHDKGNANYAPRWGREYLV
jgi:hypothetical protein